MQLVDAPHEREIAFGDRPRHVVHRRPGNTQKLRLPADRDCVLRVDHRFALSMPALVSAPSKKSFSSASCPILACSTFTSTGGSSLARGPSKTSPARSSNCCFHCVTCVGCTSNCSASSDTVFSPPPCQCNVRHLPS